MANSFKFTIKGRNVSPQTVRVEDLVEVVSKLKNAIYSAAIDAGKDKSSLALSLTAINDGSNELSFEGSTATKAGTSRITASIQRGDISDLPSQTQKEIRDLWTKAKNRRWQFDIQNGSVATIDPAKEFPKPRYIEGRSQILAKIERAGGTQEPSVIVYLSNGNKRRLRIKNTDVASKIGGMLYKTVELIGNAKWAASTGELVSFHVTDLGGYVLQQADPSAAMESIRAINPSAWANIDPDEYLKKVRGDDRD